jgi:Fic-DOC domain mobile mystery protein B
MRKNPDETGIDLSHLLRHLRSTITTRSKLDGIEAENIRKVALAYLAKRPTKKQAAFDFSWALKLHKQMFCDVWKFAGKLRTADVSIGLPWHQVETALDTLIKNLHVWNQARTPLIEQAAWLHHRAVQIHPFLDGNGRWARMMADIWLRQNRHEIVGWPSTLNRRSPARAEYIQALKQADSGDLEPLINMHKQYSSKE